MYAGADPGFQKGGGWQTIFIDALTKKIGNNFSKRGVTTTRHERELIFLYLFSISNKVTFRIFFY